MLREIVLFCNHNFCFSLKTFLSKKLKKKFLCKRKTCFRNQIVRNSRMKFTIRLRFFLIIKK